MTLPILRVAVRAFGPFESAIQKQFDDFCRVTGTVARLEAVPMDLEHLSDALFPSGGLRDGTWDIGFIVTDWLAMAVDDGHVADLSLLSGHDRQSDADLCWPSCLRSLQQVGSATWGVPYHDGPQCLIYRSDLFDTEAAAFADATGRALTPPRTWDEFVQVARFFTDPGAGRWGTVVASYPDAHNTVYDFCAQVWSRGGQIVDATGNPALCTTEAAAGLDFYRWLVKESGVVHPEALLTDSVRSGALFAQGAAAMMTNWFGFAAHAVSAPESAVQGCVNVAPMPCATDAESASVLVYWLLAIGSGSRNKDLASRFIRHATSAAMDRLLTLEGGIGCHSATWQHPSVISRIPFAAQMGRLHGLARTLPVDRRLPDLAAIINLAMKEGLTTEDASNTILARAQNRAADLWKHRV